MSVKKDIKKILEILEPFEKDIILKAKKYVELKDQIEKVKFRVKKISYFVDDKGDYGVNVEYEVPSIRLSFNDKNEIIENETFKNINLLNMVSFSDMEKISNALEQCEKMNKR